MEKTHDGLATLLTSSFPAVASPPSPSCWLLEVLWGVGWAWDSLSWCFTSLAWCLLSCPGDHWAIMESDI